MEDNETDKKCREIIEAIVAKCDDLSGKDKEPKVGFWPDWGGNSMTVSIAGKGHSHVGEVEADFDALVDNLYAMICESGPHLSFAEGTH